MQRSLASQQLPHAAASAASKARRHADSNRKALAASISAAALLQVQVPATTKNSTDDASFVITDLLPSCNGDAKSLLPLSPIKQSSSSNSGGTLAASASSPTLNIFTGPVDERQQSQQAHHHHHRLHTQLQYLKTLEAPENVELFTYASALCHRVTGKYLPKAALADDPDLQKREIERIQRDPEILTAISTIRVGRFTCSHSLVHCTCSKRSSSEPGA